MASDRRWTGGTANREWQSGTRMEAPVDGDYLMSQVRRYLHDCARFRPDPRYHPAEDGVLKIVFCQNGAQKRAVVAAYRQLTAMRRAEAHGQVSG